MCILGCAHVSGYAGWPSVKWGSGERSLLWSKCFLLAECPRLMSPRVCEQTYYRLQTYESVFVRTVQKLCWQQTLPRLCIEVEAYQQKKTKIVDYFHYCWDSDEYETKSSSSAMFAALWGCNCLSSHIKSIHKATKERWMKVQVQICLCSCGDFNVNMVVFEHRTLWSQPK